MRTPTGCRAISRHTCRANSVSRRVTVLPSCFPTFRLLLSSCSESFVRAGTVQVNVNPLYSPRELEHQLNDAGAETIVIFSGSSSTLADVITGTRVKNVITVN